MAVYVKPCWSATALNAVTIPRSFEFIALKVNLSRNNSINVVGVYRPPSAVSGAINKLTDLLARHSDSEMLFLGDFNLNWLTNDSTTVYKRCVAISICHS